MARKSLKKAIVPVKEEEHLPALENEVPAEILADPRKVLFFRFYFDRESFTYGNMKGSAIRAGFEESYAHNMTALKPKWLYDFIGRQDFVLLAETHLKEVLMLPNVTQAMGAFGPVFQTQIIQVKKRNKKGRVRLVNKKIKVPLMVPNTSVIKEKNAASKIVLPAYSPLYKDRGPKVKFNFNINATKEKYK